MVKPNKAYVVGFMEEWIVHAKSARHEILTTALDVSIIEAAVTLLKAEQFNCQHATPGPWQWYWREEDGKADCGVFHEKLQGHAYAVARCPQYQKREQWEADARLIAAAPELLAACEAMANAPVRLDSSGFAEADEERRNALKMIGAAIKKATDGSSPPLPTEEWLATIKDAKRYRWLRTRKHTDIAACWLFEPADETPETAEELDRAIDK